MRSALFYIISLIMLLGVGCSKEDILYGGGSYREKLVVDGRIEQGGCAVVMLSLNKPYDDTFTEEQLREVVVRWAKVTVSDSQQSEVLTGRYDRDYPTRFIYTGSEIIGRVGESYDITIEYSGRVWSATTTIPDCGELDEFEWEMVDDSLYRLSAVVDPMDDDSYCMIECALGDKRYYRPALLGVLKGSSEARRVTINRPIDYSRIEKYTTLFSQTDTIRLRLSTMSEVGYNYWSQWENNNVNSLNPIFPAEHNPPTNIIGDAIGIWAGYGATYYDVPHP